MNSERSISAPSADARIEARFGGYPSGNNGRSRAWHCYVDGVMLRTATGIGRRFWTPEGAHEAGLKALASSAETKANP